MSIPLFRRFELRHWVILLGVMLLMFRCLIDPARMLTWDAFGYYLYLPAQFIYHDLGLTQHEWLSAILEKYRSTATLYQIYPMEDGQWVIKYTMGLSILNAPFFFVAHMLAEPLGYPADGFSLPYQYILTLGGLVYAFAGLWYWARVLRCFFTEKEALWVLLLVYFGTNYFHLTIYDGTLLSHNYLFTLYAVLLYYTIRWYEQHQWGHAVIMGLAMGFMVLIRPTEVICVLIPLVYATASDNYWRGKWQTLRRYPHHILLMVVCAVVVVLPQLLYWMTITGEWLHYSYNNPGEGLDFASPHILQFLFSFRKGWFIYTPVMIAAVVGLVFLYHRHRSWFYLCSLVLALDVYISASWTTWWYAGGSFSSRTLVPVYGLLSIPLGLTVRKIAVTPRPLRAILVFALVFFVTLNLFQTWQFQNGILSKERMTWPYYRAIFGKTTVSLEDRNLLLVNRSVSGMEVLDDALDYTCDTLVWKGFQEIPGDSATVGGFRLAPDQPFCQVLDMPYDSLTSLDHAWLRISVRVFIPAGYRDELPLLVAAFHYKGQPYKYRSRSVKQEEAIRGGWHSLEMDYLTPEVRTSEDNLKVYLWHRGTTPVRVRDFVVRRCEKH